MFSKLYGVIVIVVVVVIIKFITDYHERCQQIYTKDIKFSIEHQIYYSEPSILDTQTNYVPLSYCFINCSEVESESEQLKIRNVQKLC